MRKTVSKFFVNLLNLRPGKNIYVRFIIKTIFWVFTILSILYVLWGIQSLVKINSNILYLKNIEVDAMAKRTERVCSMQSNLNLKKYLDSIKKFNKKADNGKKIKLPTDEEKEAIVVNNYNKCVRLEGFDMLQRQLSKKPTMTAPVKNTK